MNLPVVRMNVRTTHVSMSASTYPTHTSVHVPLVNGCRRIDMTVLTLMSAVNFHASVVSCAPILLALTHAPVLMDSIWLMMDTHVHLLIQEKALSSSLATVTMSGSLTLMGQASIGST